MNSGKVNRFFLTTIILQVLIVVLLVVFRYVFSLGIIANFIVSSGIILVPAALSLLRSGDDWREAVGFHRIRWSTAGMIVLFTFLTMPVAALINAVSMLFVQNAITEISGQILELPFAEAFFFMAVSAPVCEEIVFRGIAYRGYKRSGTLLQAVIFSALIFALGHMNFNQAAYTFAVGIMLALLVEAAGSIWASVIYHVVFNGYGVCTMYLADKIFPDALEMELPEGRAYLDSMIYNIGISLAAAAVFSAIAVCVLIRIAANENRTRQLGRIWTTRHDKKGKMVTVPFVIAAILSVAYMVTDVILYKLF